MKLTLWAHYSSLIRNWILHIQSLHMTYVYDILRMHLHMLKMMQDYQIKSRHFESSNGQISQAIDVIQADVLSHLIDEMF